MNEYERELCKAVQDAILRGDDFIPEDELRGMLARALYILSTGQPGCLFANAQNNYLRIFAPPSAYTDKHTALGMALARLIGLE